MTTSLVAADPKQRKRVLSGTLIGTTIEWYDFLIYAQAAGIVLAPLYLEPASQDNAQFAQIIAWATLGISFLFRPLGAVIAGHLGDTYGRKMILVFTLIGMGVATFLIGVLPTYDTIGIAAPILLILLRILQGVSAGGEWGGAALMSVEYAPDHRRGFFGAFPQSGVPLGLTLATAVMLITMGIVGTDNYLEWGWRIPFLLSIVLVVIGYAIRRLVDESPVFQAMQAESAQRSAPLPLLFKKHWGKVIQGALIFAAQQAAGYLVIAFLGSYAQKTLGMSPAVAWTGTLIGGILWTVFMFVAGAWSDKIGRRNTFIIGYVLLVFVEAVMWFLIDSANPWLYVLAIAMLAIPLALTLGPQPAMYAEMFPADVRYSGVSIAYALGAILGGAFAPMIAQLILDETGQAWMISVYLIALTVPAFIALLMLPKNMEDRDLLNMKHEEV
ncbi:MFS transporter [uncultured Corynebacterium sp.]|uniref:MFS transporter n=1 Tax=uncultured Corynebacterium sp. TaxID=159447 RepID=UPI0025F8C47F|nr:MFS transporter [uncultured Corynebacterium sp.]